MKERQEEMQETQDKINLKDILVGAGGALLPFIPLELFGMGGAALVTGAVGGIFGYVYSDEITDFVQNRLPALQKTHDMEQVKRWLLTRPGETIQQEVNKPSPEVSHVELQTENGPVLLPVAPAFKDMQHLITKDKLILCYSAEGPVYGTVEDLLSMAVVGKPGKGKTVSLMYYVAMLLKSGAEVFIWDPHGVMGELALLNDRALKNMPPTAKVTYLDRKEEIINSVPVLQQKLVARDEEYRRDKKAGRNFDAKGIWQKHPLLLLADELPVIALYEEETEKQYKQMNKQRARDDEEPLEFPSMTLLVQRFVLEARKWRCFFIGSGQSTDAQVLPTRVVENMSSRIVFFSSDRRARMAGLEQEAIKEYLPLIRRAGPGTMIFDCSRLDEPLIGAIPYIDTPDLMALLAADVMKTKVVDDLPQKITAMTNKQEVTLTLEQLLAITGQAHIKNTGDLLEEARVLRSPYYEQTTQQYYQSQYRTEPDLNERRIDQIPTMVQRNEQSTVTRAPQRYPKYQKALKAWSNGHQTVRDMAAALNIPESAAYTMMKEMDQLGLIQMKKRKQR